MAKDLKIRAEKCINGIRLNQNCSVCSHELLVAQDAYFWDLKSTCDKTGFCKISDEIAVAFLERNSSSCEDDWLAEIFNHETKAGA